MAFTIPNHADADSPFQAEPDSVDFDILAAGYSGSGVISGCAVTAQSTPDMTVAVASGIVSVAGVRAAVSGANTTIGTADGTNPRFDTITINSSGAIATTAGTAASVPELPAIPSVSVVLALIFVPANDTTIATVQITDKRVFISNGGSGVLDNIIWNLGSDGDAAMVLSSSAVSADVEVTNVIEGTSDHLGTAANSLIISNITDDGDIMFVVSDGGNSKGLLKLDGANGRVVIHGGDLLMSGAQKIYFYDVGGEYMSSDGSTLTITGATALTPTVGATAWNAAQHTHAGSTTGGTVTATSATVASTVVVVDGTDASSFVAIFDSATGSLAPKTDGGLTYDASSGMLTATGLTGPLTGNASGSSGSTTGNAATATALATARTIGGTSFDGTANIAVGLSATTTALASARTIGGVSFDGTGNINLPGVNTAGNQATSGLAATATLAATTTALATARDIGGVSFDGTGNINLPGVNASGSQNTSGTAAGLSATLAVASGGTNLTSYAVGDIVYASGTTTLAKLTKGAATTVLTMGGSNAPTWAAPAAAGGVPNPFFFS
jgi:hypothetical protein